MSTTDTSPTKRSSTSVVVLSLAVGMVTSAVLTMVVFPGATEGVSTGAVLLGFALGWATLRALSAKTRRPQPWAAVPAAAMAATGLALIAFDPSDHALGVLTWVWPPLALALTVWTYLHMRRDMAGAGRWLVSATLLVFAATAVGAGARQVSTEPFADANPIPGTTFSVNGHDLHIDCRGQGSPTVVLFNGLGEFSASWARIVDGTAPAARVCAYDRPGQGWSDDLAEPQEAVCGHRGPPRPARGRRRDRPLRPRRALHRRPVRPHLRRPVPRRGGRAGAARQHQPPPVRRHRELSAHLLHDASRVRPHADPGAAGSRGLARRVAPARRCGPPGRRHERLPACRSERPRRGVDAARGVPSRLNGSPLSGTVPSSC